MKDFSHQSRLNMLRVVNALDMERVGRSTFMTVTYRDDMWRPDLDALTVTRSLFQRHMERLTGDHRPGLWRVEWQVRKSGARQGTLMPHMHMIYINCPYVPWQEVQDAWQLSIRSELPARINIQEIKNARMMCSYVSKYVGKVSEDCSLVIPAYLNSGTPGRKWGMFRKKELPWCPREVFQVEKGPLWDEVRALAAESWKGVPNDGDKGFTLFGDGPKGAAEKLRQAGIEPRRKKR